MKVYISGKITGDDNYKKKFNYVEKLLLQQGYTVINPTVLPVGLEFDDYMRICFAMIDCCDIVCFMSDWKESKGAKLEHEYAEKNNKQIEYLDTNGYYGYNVFCITKDNLRFIDSISIVGQYQDGEKMCEAQIPIVRRVKPEKDGIDYSFEVSNDIADEQIKRAFKEMFENT